MTRDYKNARPKEPAKKAVPGWLWLLTGLIIGLLVALVVYLSKQPPGNTLGKLVEQHRKEVKKPVASSKVPEKKKESGLRYEFYTILENQKVVVPEQEEKNSKANTTEKVSYSLQAGSFRLQQEAESLKAKLALIGVESSVQAVSIHGDTWHRIIIGPYTSVRKINQIQNRLRENNINSIMVKSKG